MLNNSNKCKVTITTDCYEKSLEDINETVYLGIEELKIVYRDLSKVSNVVLKGKSMTATSDKRLLSILILDMFTWEEILGL